ncbi:MAG: hypothetical protein Q4C89_11255 [Deinococcus sp.]|uniref:hypothetical protein n=1 Tax=Deinococcus sp. TaxID=47478 RepID=UPI0026DA7FF6|nr:hypothetical protein [Deinococcus sp.]MDO4246590.1 hypothetical protein [Deinococcus sp.]
MRRAAFALGLLLLLTGCKREGTAESAEAEALDYVRIVAIAASNVYTESGHSIAPTPCTHPMFNMKKTSKFLKLRRCTVTYTSDQNYRVSALFNDSIAIVSTPEGTWRVKVSDLPKDQ